ncbi:MAG: MFS transporter [Oscillochloris sp.]|nr:MFS transporter [Oscillochloris sp.]
MDTSTLRHRETILAMAGLALVLFLVSLDQTVVGTAMPKVIADLNGFSLYAWVSTAYLLAETVVLPIIGKFGDIYGRKWITIIGVALFVASSAFCGMATSMPWLIIGRGIQGLGGGAILATVFTLVADIFPDLRDRARYQGMLFSVFALSSVIGPIVGGWITDTIGWRWVFYVNLPLGMFALFVLPRVLPQNVRQHNTRIDYWGALAMSIFVIALLLAFELAGNGFSWNSPQVIGGFLIAAVALAIFIPIERHSADPILPFELFRNRTFLATTTVLFLFGGGMFGLSLYTPLFVQGVLGLSASESGMVMLPMAITMPVVGIITGQLIARFGSLRPLMIGGIGIMSLGVILLTTLTTDSTPGMVAFYLFITALGMGTVMPVTTLTVQSAIAPQMLGVATSATQFIRSIGSTIGTAVIGTLVTGGYVSALSANAPEGVPADAVTALRSPNALVSAEALQSLSTLMAQVPNGSVLTQELLDTARLALTSAIHNGFLLILSTIVLAFVCSFFVAKLRLAHSTTAAEGVVATHP